MLYYIWLKFNYTLSSDEMQYYFKNITIKTKLRILLSSVNDSTIFKFIFIGKIIVFLINGIKG